MHCLLSKSNQNYYSLYWSNKNHSTDDISFIATLNGVPTFCHLGTLARAIDSPHHVHDYFGELPALILYPDEAPNSFLRYVIDYLINDVLGSYTISESRLYQLQSVQPISFPLQLLLDKHNYHLQFIIPTIVDLRQDENILWSNLRKSYRSLINKSLKTYQFHILDSHSVTCEAIEDFAKLHISVAGRITRPIETWHAQYEFIKSGDGFAILCFDKSKLIGASLFNISTLHSYYAVGVVDKEFISTGIYPAMLWKAITFSKELGISYLEVDMDNKKIQNKYFDSKSSAISFFKSGFGGNYFVRPIATRQNPLISPSAP